MDMANPFETPNTYRLHRAEYLVGLVVVAGLLIAHIGQVRWIPAVVLFVYIDLIGYIPGAIAYRRSPDHRVPKGYYIAYNIMHSLITQMAVAGIWMLVHGPEWALLVLPLHLFADRGVFGNFYKPFTLAFEPEPNPAYTRLAGELRYRHRQQQRATAEAALAAGQR
ncbi:hypothetical protein P3T37_004874 [Kitasatospora sp. MAA4]|uniref:hypothetical protein n=1 Tax=Kitasatospora sp. MAA4 TaxID=3035093 RepID=UPI002475022B|nr:hypothetical protein [Kitasatospora sp. MAA4]MDH6135459.1 hypothetical protein [Kitasatospora sp. MAA4]